jgi:Uri superfamily endonuclease
MTKEIRFCSKADEPPSLPGAYVMAIELADTVVVMLSGRSSIALPAGRYLYCGSAKGPGRIESAAFAPRAARQISALAC